MLLELRAYALDWPVWWSEQSAIRKCLPAFLIASYWVCLTAINGYRHWDHTLLGLMVLALYYGGRKTRRLTVFLMPFLWTLIVYDSQRFYADYLRGPVHVTEPYDFDKRFFGIHTAIGVLTPNEWWQLHVNPVFDFICGFFYLTFFPLYVATCAYFFFWVARKGTAKCNAAEVLRRAPRTMWAFFWLNVIGYSTYYWYAAAPPWYVTNYGLGPANMNAVASAAGCARFDLMLGTHFFSAMYGRAADVFGAIPSLHVAYPLLTVYYAFQFGTARVATVAFYLIMCFAAVYFNHHYILDVMWGSAYALLIGKLLDVFYDRKPRP